MSVCVCVLAFAARGSMEVSHVHEVCMEDDAGSAVSNLADSPEELKRNDPLCALVLRKGFGKIRMNGDLSSRVVGCCQQRTTLVVQARADV